MSYEYNYENATEKRESQKRHGRIDIPHDDPENHPEHTYDSTNIYRSYNERHYTENQR